MFVAAHEWSPPSDASPTAPTPHDLAPPPRGGHTPELYRRLADHLPDEATRADARAFLHATLHAAESEACGLPDAPQDLLVWMRNSAQLVAAKYGAYLDERKAGAPRRYFSNRSHALYFLRAVAPTKLVDGAWLYGLLPHWQNPRFSDLVQTYLEELGEGMADKNHVLLYRQLLHRHGLHPIDGLPDAFYTQGTVQLALGWNAAEFLPEVIGFNLGYEQLPLHLLVTAYELNELGIDPYYFTLHITVDNASSGHAQRAVQAVLAALPRLGDSAEFWRRLRNGFKLGNAGIGTDQVIAGFDLEREVLRILSHKSTTGHGAHSGYCRLAGRSVNDWLAQPEQIADFLAALQQAGWIRRGAPVQESRFWGLLQGERAEMFGVFSPYELQVIHDWLRGPDSADGRAYTEHGEPAAGRRATFRAAARLAAARRAPAGLEPWQDLPDPDLQALQAQLKALDGPQQVADLLTHAMSPSQHWTPAGLHATRLFRQMAA
jgi:hypothetical protein